MTSITQTTTRRQLLSTALCAYLSTWAVMIDAGMTIRNAVSVILFLLIFLFYQKQSAAGTTAKTPRLHCTAYDVCSLLFAALFLLAKHQIYTAQFSSGLFKALTMAVVLLGMFFLFRSLFGFVDAALLSNTALPIRSNTAADSEAATLQTGSGSKTRIGAFFDGHILLCSFVICLLCYLPYFLYEFPGIISPDGAWQIEQVVGARPWSNHHPVIHTACIWLFYQIGHLFTDNVNIAVSVYVFAQMCFHAFCGAYVVYTLRRLGFRRLICGLALAFYALVPFQAVYAVFVGKDTPFSDITLLLVSSLLQLLQWQNKTAAVSKARSASAPLPHGMVILFTILCILFSLFRSNGRYAFFVMIPFLVVILRRSWKQIVPSILVTLVVVSIIHGPIMQAAGIIQPDFIESCCVPLQQIARVVVDGKPLSPEDMELISHAVVYEDIPAVYDPTFADNMKELVRADGMQDYIVAHKEQYLQLWIRLGLKYPSTYLQAWADLTKGFWFPDYAYETANIDNVFANLAGVSWQPILRGAAVVKIKEIAIKLGSFLPLYGLLWSSGTYVWLLFAMTAVLWHQDKKKDLLILLPNLAIVLTLYLAVPLAAEFRYTYPLTMTLPLWLLTPWFAKTSD